MKLPDSSRELRQAQPVQTIAVVGGKGGVGKSVVAVNLATTLGANKHEVLLVDGDLEMGNVDQMLHLSPSKTLHDVFAGAKELDEILMQGPPGVTVVPSASGVLEMSRLSQIEHATLIALFSDLHTSADTLIVDVAPGLSESVVSFSGAVREVIVVVVDEPAALRDALVTVRVLHEKCRIRRFRVVVNKTESPSHGQDVYTNFARITEQSMDILLDYCGSIPFDSQLKSAVGQQEVVVAAYPQSPSALAFRKLGARVARWPLPQTPCGHIEFFVERLIQTADSTR